MLLVISGGNFFINSMFIVISLKSLQNMTVGLHLQGYAKGGGQRIQTLDLMAPTWMP